VYLEVKKCVQDFPRADEWLVRTQYKAPRLGTVETYVCAIKGFWLRKALIISSAKTLGETRALRSPRLSNQRVTPYRRVLRRAGWPELRSRPLRKERECCIGEKYRRPRSATALKRQRVR
jgi:hypothetical protein